jgi:hypothetical protein
MASGRSVAPKLTDRGAKEREEHGEFGSGLTGARAAVWRPGDGDGAKRSRELGGEGFQRWRGEEKGSVRCSGGRRGGFYRAGGAPGRGGRG